MNHKLIVTIGLETHVQLDTKTKAFCGCAVSFAKPPNSLVCPVCLGLPGALPVLNKKAFLLGLRAVLALTATPSKKIKFDRKNYFYPDLPKGYQISQYDCPLGRGGSVDIEAGGKVKSIKLNRVHMEEDAGKLIHDESPDSSYVDLNRAGTPLIEIVTEPDIDSPDEAYAYLTQLKNILKAIGVSECNMEMGQLRCDANISLRREIKDPLGKKVEIKNLNSFKAVKQALEHEIERQSEALGRNGTILQETRLWDDAHQKTVAMRSKEGAHDYRYFPEPDLVPFFVTDAEIKAAREALPELPQALKKRLIAKYQLSPYDAELLAQDAAVARFFESTAKISKNFKSVANWIIGPVFTYLSAKNVALEATQLRPENLARLLDLVEKGDLSLQTAKEKIFEDVIEKGLDPEKLMREKGLLQVSDDGALDAWIIEAIAENPKVVADFKSGKPSAAMFFVGQVMRKSKGKANPNKLQERIAEKLAGA